MIKTSKPQTVNSFAFVKKEKEKIAPVSFYWKAIKRCSNATKATKLNRSYNRMIINLIKMGKGSSEIAEIVSLHAKGKISQTRVIYWLLKMEKNGQDISGVQDIETKVMIAKLPHNPWDENKIEISFRKQGEILTLDVSDILY